MLVLAEVTHFAHLALHLQYQQSSVRKKGLEYFCYEILDVIVNSKLQIWNPKV